MPKLAHTHTHTHTHIYIYIYKERERERMEVELQNAGPFGLKVGYSLIIRRPGFNPRSSHTKDSNNLLKASLLNTQYYKVQIKGKWNNPGRGGAPSPTPQCSSYWKGNLRVTLDFGWNSQLQTSRMWHKINFKRSTAGWNSEFPFCWTGSLPKTKKPTLPNCFQEKNGSMTFRRALARSETPTASFRIWTRVADFISHNDNRYAKWNAIKKSEIIFYPDLLNLVKVWTKARNMGQPLTKKNTLVFIFGHEYDSGVVSSHSLLSLARGHEYGAPGKKRGQLPVFHRKSHD